jgi:hypothetical protein
MSVLLARNTANEQDLAADTPKAFASRRPPLQGEEFALLANRNGAGRVSAKFHNGAPSAPPGSATPATGSRAFVFSVAEPLVLYVIHV